MIKNILRRIVPRKLISKLRLGKDSKKYIAYIEKISKSDNNQADYILGTPLHTNLGDHLIAVASIYLLNKYTSRKIIEIPTEVFQSFKKKIIKIIPDDSIIYINGGGWMGNVWPNDELSMQDIVKTFYKHKVIILPQTIYFDSGRPNKEKLINLGRNSYLKCKNLVLCVREKSSLEFAEKYYKGISIKLMPDIALAFCSKIKKEQYTRKVGICLRNDREKIDYERIIIKIKDLFSSKGYRFENITTMSQKRISMFEREEIVEQKMKEFSEFDYIITDRLHGMIFSLLVNVPCIILDNSTHKVRGVYQKWLKDNRNVFPIFNQIVDMRLVDDFIENDKLDKSINGQCFQGLFQLFLKEMNSGRN